jgi:hypothetical protein
VVKRNTAISYKGINVAVLLELVKFCKIVISKCMAQGSHSSGDDEFHLLRYNII